MSASQSSIVGSPGDSGRPSKPVKLTVGGTRQGGGQARRDEGWRVGEGARDGGERRGRGREGVSNGMVGREQWEGGREGEKAGGREEAMMLGR